MRYYEKDGYMLIRRHWIVMLLNYLKFIFLMSLAGLLFYIAMTFQGALGRTLVVYVMFPAIFLTINFAFLKLIFDMIKYFNRLIVIDNHSVIVIKTSLIETDNIELIGLGKIIKIDTAMRGIFQNLFVFGDMIIEQADTTRFFDSVYRPYQVANYIKEAQIRYEKELVKSGKFPH